MVNVDWKSELPIKWEVAEHAFFGYHRIVATLERPGHPPLYHLMCVCPNNLDPNWLVRAKRFITDYFLQTLNCDPPRPA